MRPGPETWTNGANDGTLPAAIGRRYRLDDAPRAHRELVQEHTRGKLIVVMGTQA
ncbi:zinc-binding dehydrogenase [Streptomyces decoyicus]|uniref:zinc-binding dehydrogenase n=1 Tax=Streptomyces decoyicus TaxID=249567 RepID=UPI003870ADDB